MFMQKYKINIVSKNKIANSNYNYNLKRELLSKQRVQLRNFNENLFETIILISKKTKIFD